MPVVDYRSVHVDQLASGNLLLSWAPVSHSSPLWYNVMITSLEDHIRDGFPDEIFTRWTQKQPFIEIPANALPQETLILDIQARDASTGPLENNRSVSVHMGYQGPGFAYDSLVDGDNDGWANNIDEKDDDPLVYPYASGLVWYLSGTIYDGETWLPGATVQVFSGSNFLTETTTDDNGFYRVAVKGGTYDLKIMADGFVDSFAKGIDVLGEDITQNIVLLTNANSELMTVHGVVRTSDGTGTVANVRVRAILTSGSGTSSNEMYTIADGAYSLPLYTDGTATYQLRVESGSGGTVPGTPTFVNATFTFDDDNADVSHDFVLPKVVPLDGYTRDTEGQAVGNVYLRTTTTVDGYTVDPGPVQQPGRQIHQGPVCF